jgi:hypothetical protein
MAWFGAGREASQICHHNLRHEAGQRAVIYAVLRGVGRLAASVSGTENSQAA